MTRTIANVEAYPLHWPEGIRRTPYHDRSSGRFRVDSIAVCYGDLVEELRRMGADHVVVSSNVPTKRNGDPYSSMREPEDPGVAVYFQYKGRQMVFACDKWDRVAYNIRAVSKTIEAIRGIERWGSSDMVERAFAGFAALPPSGEDWRTVLGIGRDAVVTIDTVKRRFREKASIAHPDHGGNPSEMIRLNKAMEAAEQELSR